MSRRGRAAPNNNRNNSLRVALGSLKSSLHGHENKLRGLAPPPVNQIPFNTIVVAEDIPGNTSFVMVDINSLSEKLRDQIYLNATDRLRVKVQRIDFWSTPDAVEFSGGTGTIQQNPKVEAKFYSLVQSIGGTTNADFKYPVLIKELDDEGMSGVTAAVVSYQYPRAQSDIPMKPAPSDLSITDPRLIAAVRAPVGCTVKARYHLHWNTVEPENELDFISVQTAKLEQLQLKTTRELEAATPVLMG